MKEKIKFISSKPYKQWCKAREIDFKSHMEKYPYVKMRLGFK